GFAQPVCQSQSSSAITSTSANVTYYVNANGKFTTLTIQYNTINTDSALNAGPSQGDGAVQSVFNGSRTATLTGLSIKKTYYWRVVGTNTNGTTKSGILSFTTLGEKPTITLLGAQGRYNFGLIDYDLNT
ncbi:MAG: hypothetical protein ACOVOV_13705, partial [Dolichospermum sp.]